MQYSLMLKSLMLSQKNCTSALFALVVVGYVAWAFIFVFRSFFIAIDGDRYFCLFDDAMISIPYA
jgi:hypothetical protein